LVALLDGAHDVSSLARVHPLEPPRAPDPSLRVRSLLTTNGWLEAVEITAADRPGLLAAISGALFVMKLQIVRCEARTVRGRVRDCFYLEELDGAPVSTVPLSSCTRYPLCSDLAASRAARKRGVINHGIFRPRSAVTSVWSQSSCRTSRSRSSSPSSSSSARCGDTPAISRASRESGNEPLAVCTRARPQARVPVGTAEVRGWDQSSRATTAVGRIRNVARGVVGLAVGAHRERVERRRGQRVVAIHRWNSEHQLEGAKQRWE
jgi:hypothetical protein